MFSLAGAFLVPLVTHARAAEFPFRDPSLPIEQRVADLVGRLTPEEKISQMTMTAAAIPRFGIPEYTWWNEGLHGVARSGYATVFPQAIGLAATWDTKLMHSVGDTVSTEARAKYADAIAHGNHRIYFGLTIWSPNINIFRDPRWGRGQETYGEDPFLTSQMGLAFITGLQGDNPRYLKVVATPKHFAVHSGPEQLRHEFNVDPSPQDLEATYFPAFHSLIDTGKAASTMCAYNSVDGVPACANDMLLKKTLRGEWKFGGFVTSDCWAVTDIWKGHKFTSDEEHAAALALRAGTDTTCGPEFAALKQALDDKLVSQTDIDTAVKRLFTARFRLGMFDPPQDVPFAQIPMSEVDSQAHRELARQVARESMVLLKNTGGALPLQAKGKTIVVIGPNATMLESLEGNYYGQPRHPVLPLDGVESRFSDAKVLYAQGSSYVAGFPVVVPRTVLRSGHEVGLKGQYFRNAQWQGQPVLTRVDKQVDFDWNAASPAEGIPANAFSVRWSGSIAVPGAGDYVFEITPEHCSPCDGTDQFRFFLDGKQAFESVRDQKQVSGKASFNMHFNDTAPHAIRVEYAHTAPMFGAGIHLKWQPEASVMRDQAVQTAKQGDLVVAFMGLSPSLEGEEMPVHLEGFSGGDRTKIDLPQLQVDLLQAVAGTGKPLVVVLMNGSALSVPWATEHAAAILEAWYPGEEGGAAIAETLAGDNDPAGRLPVTFYTSVGQLPAFEDYSMAGRTYRYFSGQPLYTFGYGLSYTTFAFNHLKLSQTDLKAGDPLTAEADVTNTGKRKGEEVVELYLRGPQTEGAPLRSLRGFQRVILDRGETKHVSFTLTPEGLSEVDRDGRLAMGPGDYTIFLGGGQPGQSAGVEGRFVIHGQDVLEP
ncbi:MAG TPA: glycoside hydrolase family 3 C-terminal domain-containing protein [Acidobacteriaceae bacterium]|nr:glycoside hydrolase family 3 C-terminal domain-containing protein [Acidobacteriaceae bacterium]